MTGEKHTHNKKHNGDKNGPGDKSGLWGKKAPEAGENNKASSQEVDYKDKWLRALADYENLKKRTDRERIETIKFSNHLLIIELFPIMDSFDSAIKSMENSSDRESFLKGLKMLQAELHRILEANGLKKIKSLGEKFDPNMHQAEEEIYTDKFAAGTIAEEIRSGYLLNDKLLRPALVKVSKGKMEPGLTEQSEGKSDG
ncbi:MAG: nucleotide exchange factor GrpE [Candidatus Omnitrophica bacterium]|nr:nucleotide exchange factor GrpE [Candidatus Omnitrophota bacterium]